MTIIALLVGGTWLMLLRPQWAPGQQTRENLGYVLIGLAIILALVNR